MLFSKFTGLFLLFFTLLVTACPISERQNDSDGLEARSPFWNGKTDPGLKTCKTVNDCKCPKGDPKKIHSTSCINGRCKCDDPGIALFANTAMKAIQAIGNAPITKAMGNLMQGLADAKQVLGTIVGSFLGPEAKLALKVALNAFPDTGPSHIDQATKKFLTKGF